MEYNKLDKNAIKGWRISRLIVLIILLIVFIPGSIFLVTSGLMFPVKTILLVVIAALAIYTFVGLIVYPSIEYKQWGYLVEEDRVVIRHGIFFIRKVIVPIIRIQNITVSQGPINRKLGLYKVTMALASGSFEIEGLSKETADEISENLKSRLYNRLAEKGNVTDGIWT